MNKGSSDADEPTVRQTTDASKGQSAESLHSQSAGPDAPSSAQGGESPDVPPRASTHAGAELPDGLPKPRRYWAILTLMAVLVISVLDATMVNVALPSIAQSLDIAPADVVRVVLAYNLALVITLLPFSAIAERIGFRRMFAIGIGLFGLASLASALSTSLLTLMLARIAQGLGSSMLMCLFGGLVRNIYPLRKLGMGLSLNASMVGVTAVLGPTIGAAVMAVASWPWIFLINLPICVLAYFGIRFLPDVPRAAGRFDWVAALLSAPVFGLAILGLDALGETPLFAILCFAGAGLFAHILLKRSRGQSAPLVPVDLLRIVAVRYAVGSSLMLFAAQMGSFVAMPFYFHRVLGYSYAELGVALGAWSIGTAMMAPISAYFSERYSIAKLCAIGAAGVAGALSALLLLPNDSGVGWFLLAMFAGGVGFGFFQTPNNRAMLMGAPRRRSGAAGGLQATTRVFGQGVGTALVAVAFSLSEPHGPALGMGVGIVCALIAVGINIARQRNPESDPKVQ